MLRRLYLLRHTKSDAHSPTGEDFDRPLSPRGVRAALVIGEYMRQRDYGADLVLCSPARRTRETLDIVRKRQRAIGRAQFDRDLYLADTSLLLARIRAVPSQVAAVLVIGHNPTLHELAVTLAVASGEDAYRSLREKFVTGALVVFEIAADDWAATGPRQAKLVDFAEPKMMV